MKKDKTQKEEMRTIDSPRMENVFVDTLPLWQLGYESAFKNIRKEVTRLFNTNRKNFTINLLEFLYSQPEPTKDYFKD